MIQSIKATKNCAYCGNSFEATATSRKVYCSGTCKTYASQQRTGKREAVANDGGEVEQVEKQNVELILNQFNARIREIKGNILQLEQQAETIDNLSSYKINRHLDGVKEKLFVLNKSELSQKERKAKSDEYNRQIRALKQELKEIEEAKKKRPLIEPLIQNLKLEIFRTKELRNDFYLTNILKSKEIKGDEIARFSEYVTRYPFAEIERDFICYMGTPEQPFIFPIEGEKGSGKTILAVSYASMLIEFFQAKILYITEAKDGGKVVEYFKKKGTISDLLTIKITDSSNDITNAVREGDFEFLFIDNASAFHTNIHLLKSLQRLKPKLSIFPISNSIPAGILADAYGKVYCEPYTVGNASKTHGSQPHITINGIDIDPECGMTIFLLHRREEGDNFSFTL